MTQLPRITIEPDPGDIADEIERNLLAALRGNTPASDYAPFAVVARGADRQLVGGLVGGTSYGWLLVKMLWVAEPGRGLGSRLMDAAEQAAQARGCHGAWLDTSSARADAFYRKRGYAPFGLLENLPGEHPRGHRRAFLSKRFARVP